jgi:hypothetical protein
MIFSFLRFRPISAHTSQVPERLTQEGMLMLANKQMFAPRSANMSSHLGILSGR